MLLNAYSYNDNEIETIAFVSFLVKIAILTKTNAKTIFCFKFDMSANIRYCPALSRSMCPKHYMGTHEIIKVTSKL